MMGQDAPNTFQNPSQNYQRPGLSYANGAYAGYNPLYSGSQPAPARVADWNWISMNFTALQSSIQAGGTLNMSGQTLQNPRVFGLVLGDMTPGSVLFIGPGSAVAQNNASFFWDSVNKRLGIGNAAPQVDLHVTGTARVTTLGASGVVYANASSNLTTNSGFQYDPTNKVVTLNQTELDFYRSAQGPSYDDATHLGGIQFRSSAETAFLSGLLLRFQGGYLFEDVTGNVVTWRFIIAVNGNSNFGMASSNTKTPLSKLEVTGNMLVGPESWTGVNTAPTNGFMCQGQVAIGTATNNSAAYVQITNDAATDAAVQMFITGATDENRRLELGYNSSANHGVIQARQNGTGVMPLFLQPGGGNVIIGSGINPAQALHIYQTSPFLQIESSGTGANGIKIALNGSIRWVVGNLAADANLTFADGSGNKSLTLGGSSKIGFFATAPVALQTSAGGTAYADAGAVVVHTAGTFTGASGATAYTIGDIVTALKAYGLLTA